MSQHRPAGQSRAACRPRWSIDELMWSELGRKGLVQVSSAEAARRDRENAELRSSICSTTAFAGGGSTIRARLHDAAALDARARSVCRGRRLDPRVAEPRLLGPQIGPRLFELRRRQHVVAAARAIGLDLQFGAADLGFPATSSSSTRHRPTGRARGVAFAMQRRRAGRSPHVDRSLGAAPVLYASEDEARAVGAIASAWATAPSACTTAARRGPR